MSGLLRRIRRPGAAEETRTEASELPEPAHGSAPETAPVPAVERPLPAGMAPDDLERRSRTERRGKLRRRARFLRRARELALRDLGGFVYEAHRRAQDGAALVKEKVQRLGAIDQELNALEAELGAPRGQTVLREPGVGGTCPRCGELHASDAHFCSRCGLDLTAVPAQEAAAEQAVPAAAASEPAAAEPATSDAAPPSDEAADAVAEHPTAAEPATEQPTTDLTAGTQAGNGRAAAKDGAPKPAETSDRGRSA